MEETYVIHDLEQVKILADPLRTRLIETMRDQAMTAKQMAETLGEKPTRIYHHVNALEKAGLIRLIETRRNRGTLEKYYQPVAKLFIVDRDLFAPELGEAAEQATSAVAAAMTDMLHKTEEEIRQGIAAKRLPLQDSSRIEVARVAVRATPKQIEKLVRKVQSLLEEAQASETGEATEDALLDYRLLVAFYPVGNSGTE